MEYLLHLVTLISLYTVLSLSLNIVVGYGGMILLCHAAFYGLGAYISSILVLDADWPYLVSMLTAITLTSGIAACLAAVTSRLKGDFLLLATLGFQTIVFSLLYNLTDLTRGPYGVLSIPRPTLLGMDFSTTSSMSILIVAIAILYFLFIRILIRSPFGRVLEATRDCEIAAASLGKDVLKIRRQAYAIAAGGAALAGTLYASYASYIDPTNFGIEESIFILTIVIIGGAGNLRGPIVGSVVVLLLPEALRFLEIPDHIAANIRQVLYGIALVLMMRFRPQGIAGKYTFE